MNIHILGIAGTFMAGIARLAMQLGHRVSGSDNNFYSPIREELASLNITTYQGYNAANLEQDVELVIIGNAVSRGNDLVEYVLDKNIPFTSAPLWLYENVLQQREVIAVTGTHGKTTVTAMLTCCLRALGSDPGYLIAGVAHGIEHTANLGTGKYFVIEADEYDSSFFDKKPKFMHYRPKTLIINNLEFDHADIYNSLQEIKQEFKWLLRLVPQSGTVIYPKFDQNVCGLIAEASFSHNISFTHDQNQTADYYVQASQGELIFQDQRELHGKMTWQVPGQHNAYNAAATIAALLALNFKLGDIMQALATFKGVKRRLEYKGKIHEIAIYDDFAHHPTAISYGLHALKALAPKRLVLVLELQSYTMLSGVHQHTLLEALASACKVFIYKSAKVSWDVDDYAKRNQKVSVVSNIEDLVELVVQYLMPYDILVFMSNSGNSLLLPTICDKLAER